MNDDSTTQPDRNMSGVSKVIQLDRMPTQTKADCGTTTLGNYDNLKSVSTAQSTAIYNAALQEHTNSSERPVSQNVVSQQSPTQSNSSPST